MVEQKLEAKNDGLRHELKHEMNALRSDLKAEIAVSHNNLLKWIIPLFLSTVGMFVTSMIKFFPINSVRLLDGRIIYYVRAILYGCL